MDLGPHAVFIVSAYAGVTVATLALIGWVVASSLRVKARIAALEAAGVRRRSSGSSGTTA